MNSPSYVTSIAPAKPIIAEPIIKIFNCCLTIFLPMALAAVSLSRIALIILPHGELTALYERYKSVNKVIEKIIVKQSFTNIPELEIITSFVVGAQK